MRPLPLALIAATALVFGCSWPDYSIIDATYYHDCSNHEGDEWTLVWDNPAHCGACGNDCPAGVPCVGTACQFDTVLHCGEADRRCVAAGDQPRAVSCVAFGEGETPPDGVEVIKGHGCVALDPPPRVVVGGDGEPEVVEPPKLDGVRWLTVPGHSAACDDGLDANACATAVVAYTDACAEPITERFAYEEERAVIEDSRAASRCASWHLIPAEHAAVGPRRRARHRLLPACAAAVPHGEQGLDLKGKHPAARLGR